MFILKKIIRITVTTTQGVLMGFFLNFSWHFFLASIIGWGDSAPDWYFNIQEIVFMSIFLFGLIGWIIFNLRLRRKPWLAQLVGYNTETHGHWSWMPISGNSLLRPLYLFFAFFRSARQATHLAQVDEGDGSSRDLR